MGDARATPELGGKMSGAEFEFSAVCSLPSRSSFWIDWRLTVTFG
jgi:hypothetical protein